MREGYIEDYVSKTEVKATPEEIQAVQPFERILVEDYGYPMEYLITHPQYRVKVRPSDTKKEYPVDIAVFSDKQKSDDDIYIVVECKKKARLMGEVN
ncbi:MAG: type I restriction enzyme HsdR N-terminal domain-containing protein [Roseburia sp.]|nr:type I restriction enzyme HsdR N-terminal domain-containing protein [Roseburia sp.]MCM1243140.1 type I restriction enzyme HsdR N-terminal domain-containing protein [Roseburia sp.]